MGTLVTGLMMIAALDSMGSVFNTHKLNSERLTGPGLAHELMAEIMSMPYKDPNVSSNAIGTEAGESSSTRAAFDDVDDYHGLNVLGIRTKSGTLRSGLSQWRQQVSVQWIQVLTGLPWIVGDTDLKRITVTVTSPTGAVCELVGYRYKEGMLEQPPAIDMQVVSWISAELQLGEDATPARTGINITNHANAP